MAMECSTTGCFSSVGITICWSFLRYRALPRLFCRRIAASRSLASISEDCGKKCRATAGMGSPALAVYTSPVTSGLGTSAELPAPRSADWETLCAEAETDSRLHPRPVKPQVAPSREANTKNRDIILDLRTLVTQK